MPCRWLIHNNNRPLLLLLLLKPLRRRPKRGWPWDSYQLNLTLTSASTLLGGDLLVSPQPSLMLHCSPIPLLLDHLLSYSPTHLPLNHLLTCPTAHPFSYSWITCSLQPPQELLKKRNNLSCLHVLSTTATTGTTKEGN